MAVLTHEEQAVLRAVRFARMPTDGACLTAVVGINLDGHRLVQECFIGNHTMQFSKGPLGIGGIALPLLPGNRFGSLAVLLAPMGAPFGALTNVGQILQADQAVGVLVDDACGNDMIGVLLQPSLPSTDSDESPRGGSGAFFLKTLSQSCIMVGFRDNRFARMKRLFSLRGSRDRQVADPDIHTDDVGMGVFGRISYLQLQTDEQVELLLGLVIPEFSGSDLGSLLNQCHVLGVTRIGNHHTTIQGQDREVCLFLEAVILLVLIGQRGRNKFRSLIQAFEALLGVP